mmetsp:Transcript_50910/g.59485  ORF Transcript_50910/g.59485 Transcript_50910/m.59485 type:complete len:110 (+) Transcript_50910:313-642(+)
MMQLFREDMGLFMLKHGKSNMSSSIYVKYDSLDEQQTAIIDYSNTIQNLQADGNYMDRLEKAELGAIKERIGMWGDARIRKQKSELVEFSNDTANIGIFRKIWLYFSNQ